MATLVAVTVSVGDGKVLHTGLVTLSSRVSHVSATSVAESYSLRVVWIFLSVTVIL